jgi:anti-sigma B factor antagonist
MVEIKNSLENDIYTIHVIGEVDASSSIYLDESISEATTRHKKIMVNCQQLDYISSAGLGVFMSYINDMEEKGIKLVIYGLSDKVRHVFQILGLDQLLKITNNEGEAKQIIDEV